jgi:putative SOS response-associated peptidase YedK
MSNARIESVGTSGAFKDAFQSTRCLIPADGFYEIAQQIAARTRGISTCRIISRSRLSGSGAQQEARNY